MHPFFPPMKKLLFILCVVLGPYVAAAQEVYHAGENVPTVSSAKHWEVSVGWTGSNQHIQDRAAITVAKDTEGLSARGLYYPWRWLGVGAEGTWMNQKHFFGDNSYEDARYGLISKWILTLETKPAVYLLLGAGQRKQKVDYVHLRQHTKETKYVQGGIGLEVEIYRGWFIAGEGQMMYRAKSIDKFLEQDSRWERLLTVRGGVRF